MQAFTLRFLQLYLSSRLYARTSLPKFKRRGLVSVSSMDYFIFGALFQQNVFYVGWEPSHPSLDAIH